MSERQEFSFEYLRARERQITYVLSATGACIAFSMTFADREMQQLSSIFFLVAAALWSFSFIFGLFAKNQSIKLLSKCVIVGDMLPKIQGPEEFLAETFKEADDYITSFDFRINRARNFQLALLAFGAAAFMASVIMSSQSFDWLFNGSNP